MNNITLNRCKGFTLIELVMTLVLISLLSSVAAVVVLGPFQTFYVMRDNIKLFSQFEQVSDDLEYYFSKAVPASIKISQKNKYLSFRMVEQRGWVSIDIFSTKGAMPLNSVGFQTKGMIFFPDYPEVGMQQVNRTEGKLSFTNAEVKQPLNMSQYLRYQLLSVPIHYQFNPESFQLLRIVKEANKNTSYRALVGHLSDCEFLWFPDKKRLDIRMSLKDRYQQQVYSFKQQMVLY